ncbi:MAG: hypothetical protein GW818_06545, partial [Flavobacteriales bacterium]|nr:hypothetical protein [Flavobacteriales bacterium]
IVIVSLISTLFLYAAKVTAQFQVTYGEASSDWIYSGIEKPFGLAVPGYLLAGKTNSFGNGAEDILISMTDVVGTPLRTVVYGGVGNDVAYSIKWISTNTCILTGSTESWG